MCSLRPAGRLVPLSLSFWYRGIESSPTFLVVVVASQEVRHVRASQQLDPELAPRPGNEVNSSTAIKITKEIDRQLHRDRDQVDRSISPDRTE
jgi:hypothetical protein